MQRGHIPGRNQAEGVCADRCALKADVVSLIQPFWQFIAKGFALAVSNHSPNGDLSTHWRGSRRVQLKNARLSYGIDSSSYLSSPTTLAMR